MEYVAGEDLKSLIWRVKQLTVGTAISITKQICEGLAEAHRMGVIHRDLKPSNIMIDKNGNVRIMDFGIARSLKGTGITGAGVMIGTPEYMSPEQVEGKEVDQRSDIYSLAIILYKMLTGRLPFEGDTPFTIGVKHKSEIPKDPKELNPQIPDDLSGVILKCLEKEKESRYQTADDVRSELERIEQGFPTTDRVAPKKKPLTLEGITVQFSQKKIFIPAFVVIALAVIGLIILSPWKQRESAPILSDKPSIAILPFYDLSQQKDQEVLCDGIPGSLIYALSKIRDLRVRASTSSFSFRNKERDIQEIGEKLNVKTVLDGTLVTDGNRVRITVELINVVDESLLWSEQYNRELDDVFAIQDDITLAIVDNLKLNLLGGERANLVKRYTENVEAYNLYVKARFFQAKSTAEEIKKGLDYFQQAIEKDPSYALAYAGKADCFIFLADWGYLSSKEAYPRARAAAEKALEMDDTLAGAYASLGYIKFKCDWAWAAAEKDFKRAIELDPNYAYAHINYALYLSEMGRHDEAIKEAKRALEPDPLSVDNLVVLGWIYYLARNYDRAIEQLMNLLEIDQDYVGAYWNLANAYAGNGMYNKAIVTAQKLKEFPGNNPTNDAVLGIVYSLAGRRDEAMKVLDYLLELSKQEYISPFYVALVFTCLGQKDQAFEWLDKAYEEHDVYLSQLKVFPLFDSLRSDPRYKALLKKMNLE